MLQTFRTNFQPSRLQAAFIPTDLATKEYCQFPTPVDGDDSTEMSDVWIMKKYGVTESWTLLYSIEQEAMPCALKRYKPVAFSKNGEMLLSIKDNNSLLWFDFREKRANQLQFVVCPCT
ncbi:hypothetical protein FF2_037726 [Malus domestica]